MIASWLIGILDDIQAERLRELTVGQVTTATGENERNVLCTDLATSEPCLEEHASWKGKTILWLGNSQLPTINQQKPGDQTMVEMLHESLLDNNLYVFGFAPPNANLQEHYILLEHLVDKVKPDVLLLPVFFDDLRESGIRPTLTNVLNDTTTKSRLESTDLGRTLLKENSVAKTNAGPASAMPTSSMDQSEAAINTWVESRWDDWKMRGTYRAVLFVKMHHLRNAAFGINPQSVRRMIPARYDRNMEALDTIITSAKARNIEVLMYIPPIRSDVAIPYDMAAYGQFKTTLKNIAVDKNLGFADLENVVAAEEWGTKKSATLGGDQELDFMHFSVAGHKKMASVIEKKLFSESRIVSASRNKIISVSKKKVLH